MKPVPFTAGSTRRSLRVLPAVPLGGRTALAALVGALVVGILGMHSLASHGSPAVPPTAAATTHSSDTTMAATSSEGPHARPDHDQAHGQAHGQGHGMSMVMLCVVMLAAAALTLLAMLVAGFVRPLLPDAFRPAVVRARAPQWVRGSGPPHEWAFSVIRC